MARHQDTIYALSSGSLPAGVAIIRLSGPRVIEIATALCGALPPPRQAVLRWVRRRDGAPIDQGLVLFFPSPASFTGEDCLELHVHGSRASVAAVFDELQTFDAVRPAEAGEFSRRAFDNGRMDLVEIEGLADLLAAETEMQRRLAVEQSGGRLSAVFQSWMVQLTKARAMIEAELDFSEEEDVPAGIGDSVWHAVGAVAADIRTHLHRQKSAEIVRDGFKVVIAGRPNAGKSSLLNALARRDVAIVTPIPGTTRDLLSVDLDIDGYLVKLTDTAGFRAAEDPIEQEGVRRAQQMVANADLILLLREIGDPLDYLVIDSDAKILKLATKIDTAESHDALSRVDELAISAETGQGIDSLTKQVGEVLASMMVFSDGAVTVRARQVSLLVETQSILEACLRDNSATLEIRAEYLRTASHLLGKIVGFVDVEDLLGVIFSEFCVGK